MNHWQYECLRMLAAPHNNFFAVGDDDQSVYGFRGAQPAFLLGFAQDYPDAAVVKLETNYRSSAAVVSLANALIQGNVVRSQKVMESAGATGINPIVAHPLNPHAEAQWIAEKIISLQKENPEEEIAVIFRMHIQAQAIMDALIRRHIPFSAREALPNLYTHWIARDIAAYFQLALNRLDDAALARIIHRPSRYIYKEAVSRSMGNPAGALESLYDSPLLNRRHFESLDGLTFHLNAISRRNAYDAIRFLREGIGYDDFLRSYAAHKQIDAHSFIETTDALQEAARGFDNLTDWLAHAAESANTSQSIAAAAKPSKQNVTLTTMHSAKGLEFDAVFVAGAVEGIIPHKDCFENIDEERRLLYVAMTRARQRLYISVYRECKQVSVEPSRFIEPFMADAAGPL